MSVSLTVCLIGVFLIVLCLAVEEILVSARKTKKEALVARLARENDEKRRARRSRKQANNKAISVASANNRKKSLVLLIDGDKGSLRSSAGALNESGYGVITAKSGSAALEIMKEHCPDIIVCAANLRQLNGRRLTRIVKEDLVLSDVPIILASPPGDMTVQESQKLGASGFLTKPYNEDDLIEQVGYLTSWE